MAKRQFTTKDGKVVSFESRGKSRGRTAKEDAGAAHRGEAAGEGQESGTEAGAEELLGRSGTEEVTGAGAREGETRTEDTPGDGSEGGREEARETGAEGEREATVEAKQPIEDAVPRKVGWDVRDDRPVAIGSMAAALAQLSDFAYRVPYMLGMGAHWPLMDQEAKAMGKALEGALKVLPGKSKQNAVKTLSKWMPWISVIATSYIITAPRVMQTQMGRRAASVNRTPARSVNGPLDEPRGGLETPSGDGDNTPTWEALRRNG